jgi:hypothetical protein
LFLVQSIRHKNKIKFPFNQFQLFLISFFFNFPKYFFHVLFPLQKIMKKKGFNSIYSLMFLLLIEFHKFLFFQLFFFADGFFFVFALRAKQKKMIRVSASKLWIRINQYLTWNWKKPFFTASARPLFMTL